MSVTDEIEVLRTIVNALTPLEPVARQRVIEYACSKLDVERPRVPAANTREERSNPPADARTQVGKPIPPQQYLRDYNYKIMTKRIGIMAVYLERERGLRRFSLKDVTETFRDAKESRLPAHSQYARAVVMGFLGKEGDQYYASSKAEQLVDNYNKRQGSENGEDEQ
jgi:hypothetical protein